MVAFSYGVPKGGRLPRTGRRDRRGGHRLGHGTAGGRGHRRLRSCRVGRRGELRQQLVDLEAATLDGNLPVTSIAAGLPWPSGRRPGRARRTRSSSNDIVGDEWTSRSWTWSARPPPRRPRCSACDDRRPPARNDRYDAVALEPDLRVAIRERRARRRKCESRSDNGHRPSTRGARGVPVTAR